MPETWVSWGVVAAFLTALPLAWKWQLGLLRVSLFVVLVSIPATFVAMTLSTSLALRKPISAALIWLVVIVCSVAVLLYRFYRDPERNVPSGDGLIVSPADGKVIYIRQSQNRQLPVCTKHGINHTLSELTKTPFCHDEAWLIGISMNFLDVHVNRSPIEGTVVLQRHYPGKFGSLRKVENVFDNERATTIIACDSVKVAVVQIASRLVRQIVSFVADGDRLALGQRIGAIRLGSQVDLVVPSNVRVRVRVGDRVRAGETLLAEMAKAMAITEGTALEGTLAARTKQ